MVFASLTRGCHQVTLSLFASSSLWIKDLRINFIKPVDHCQQTLLSIIIAASDANASWYRLDDCQVPLIYLILVIYKKLKSSSSKCSLDAGNYSIYKIYKITQFTNFLYCLAPPAKYLTFRPSVNVTVSSLSSQNFYSASVRGSLFRLRFWYFMYGQDEGNLTVHLRQAPSLLEPHEVSEIWNTSSRDVRNWQFQQIEKKAARSSSVSKKFLFLTP